MTQPSGAPVKNGNGALHYPDWDTKFRTAQSPNGPASPGSKDTLTAEDLRNLRIPLHWVFGFVLTVAFTAYAFGNYIQLWKDERSAVLTEVHALRGDMNTIMQHLGLKIAPKSKRK
jgi:hypothetical protein